MTVDALFLAAHPDDVELVSAGLVLRLVAAGLRVGIVDLTRGELGTRGTAEIRAREAAAAGEVLGVTYRENLGLPDGRLEADETSRRLVIEAVRRSRARLVVAPAPVDLHPDHATTGRIVERVRYLCPMPKYPAEGEAHRPSIWLWTMHHTEVARRSWSTSPTSSSGSSRPCAASPPSFTTRTCARRGRGPASVGRISWRR
jgi:bacillithiol biosynthesis deacetylase BshB1